MLLLGIAIGSILTATAFITYSRYKAPIVRQTRQIQSKMQTKGEILSIEEDETDEWIKTITKW